MCAALSVASPAARWAAPAASALLTVESSRAARCGVAAEETEAAPARGGAAVTGCADLGPLESGEKGEHHGALQAQAGDYQRMKN